MKEKNGNTEIIGHILINWNSLESSGLSNENRQLEFGLPCLAIKVNIIIQFFCVGNKRAHTL